MTAAAAAMLNGVAHDVQPPRRPSGAALWGGGKLVEHVVQDTVRERRDALLQPRSDDAR